MVDKRNIKYIKVVKSGINCSTCNKEIKKGEEVYKCKECGELLCRNDSCKYQHKHEEFEEGIIRFSGGYMKK